MEFQEKPFSQPPMPRPKNWLVESILATLLCCLPFGIVAIVNAANVNGRYDRGDYPGALAASKQAGLWTKISLWSGVALYIIGILFGVFMNGMAGLMNRA